MCIVCQRAEESGAEGSAAAFHWERIRDVLLDDENSHAGGVEMLQA